jgi:hypothetical protein
MREYLSEGYAVAYVGEGSETTTVRQFARMGIEVGGYIAKSLLTVINRDVFYSPFLPSKILLDQWKKLFASIEKKMESKSLRGFVAIGMPADSFFLSESDNRQLVQYESLAAKEYDDGSLEAMCLYTAEKIETMPLRYILVLMNAHKNTGHRDGSLREWNINRGLSIIERGLDTALGPQVTEMVKSILVRDFGNNKQLFILQPDQFERKLELLLGAPAAGIVVHHIKKELVKDIAY